MRRIIWLGDAPKSGSVYWDTKEKKAYIGKSSSIISASGSQQNGAKVWQYTGIGIAVAAILGGLLPKRLFRFSTTGDFNLKERIIIIVAWIIFTVIEVYLMNKFMYSDMRHLKSATPKQVQYAIKSTGYLTNSSIKFTRYLSVYLLILCVLIFTMMLFILLLWGVI